MCGEKKISANINCNFIGSPPRVRGKVSPIYGSRGGAGITPACAGKSCWKKSTINHYGDHPRVCGEKSAGAYQGAAALGSPPRVRGKVPAMQDIWSSIRITPACAGKSSPNHVFFPVLGDHPRVCGEKTKKSP